MEQVALNLRQYCEALATRKVEDNPAVRAWRSAKQLAWLTMLAGAFLCYHLMSKLQEALNMLV